MLNKILKDRRVLLAVGAIVVSLVAMVSSDAIHVPLLEDLIEAIVDVVAPAEAPVELPEGE